MRKMVEVHCRGEELPGGSFKVVIEVTNLSRVEAIAVADAVHPQLLDGVVEALKAAPGVETAERVPVGPSTETRQ
ncbi:MAG TPA: hypothetical protein VNZ94_00430 [Xanthobacteraceae bacterium]|nr:hypothetical protein [Xanthobacteraceae bacterium]